MLCVWTFSRFSYTAELLSVVAIIIFELTEIGTHYTHCALCCTHALTQTMLSKLMNGAWETVVINCEHSIPATPAFTEQLNMQFALKAWK